jgi:hypothetical protein
VVCESGTHKNRNSKHCNDRGSESYHQPGTPAVKRASIPASRILQHSSHDSIFEPGRFWDLLVNQPPNFVSERAISHGSPP